MALSSAEAELYAVVLVVGESLGLQSLAKDLGKTVGVEMGIDASAALALLQREGLGKAKHIQVQSLWLQESVREKLLHVHKVPTDRNPADLFTKGLPGTKISYFMHQLGFYYL